MDVARHQLARGAGVAVGHGDDDGFLEAEHVAHLRRGGERMHDRQLGRAGIAEHLHDAFVAQHAQEGVAAGDGVGDVLAHRRVGHRVSSLEDAHASMARWPESTHSSGRLARLPCWRGKVSLAPLTGGLTNPLVRRRRRRREVRRALRRRHPGPSRLPRPRAGGLARRLRGRPVARGDPCRAGHHGDALHRRPHLRRGRHARAARAHRAAAEDLPREVGRRLQGPANMFWVFHVIRDYVRAADADSKYLAIADALEGARCRCRSCSAITTCCRATSWTTAGGCG